MPRITDLLNSIVVPLCLCLPEGLNDCFLRRFALWTSGCEDSNEETADLPILGYCAERKSILLNDLQLRAKGEGKEEAGWIHRSAFHRLQLAFQTCSVWFKCNKS